MIISAQIEDSEKVNTLGLASPEAFLPLLLLVPFADVQFDTFINRNFETELLGGRRAEIVVATPISITFIHAAYLKALPSADVLPGKSSTDKALVGVTSVIYFANS